VSSYDLFSSIASRFRSAADEQLPLQTWLVIDVIEPMKAVDFCEIFAKLYIIM
jgi:hypothetical protein